MGAETARQKPLIIGLAGLLLIGGGISVWVTRAYQPVIAYFHEVAQVKIPLDDPDYMYARALDYEHEGNSAFATAAARRAVMASPSYAPAHRFLAAKALKSGDFDEAAVQCKGILETTPNDATASMGLAAAYRGMGESGKAETVYDQVLKNQVNDAVVRQTARRSLEQLRHAPEKR